MDKINENTQMHIDVAKQYYTYYKLEVERCTDMLNSEHMTETHKSYFEICKNLFLELMEMEGKKIINLYKLQQEITKALKK
jgi:hypothetical protein